MEKMEENRRGWRKEKRMEIKKDNQDNTRGLSRVLVMYSKIPSCVCVHM